MIDKSSSEPITLDGACHCGAVQFTVTLDPGFRLGAALHLLHLPDARSGGGDVNAR